MADAPTVDWDVVPGILPPYSDEFRLWHKDGSTVRQGDAVPAVGMTRTYAVRLHAPPGLAARYLWVQDGEVTNPMAHQPMQAAVFDQWGRYLGEGGQADEPPPPPGHQMPTLLQELGVEGRPEAEPTAGEQLAEILREQTPPRILRHRFHLRPDVSVELNLPADLTQADVARLVRFLETLPFG